MRQQAKPCASEQSEQSDAPASSKKSIQLSDKSALDSQLFRKAHNGNYATGEILVKMKYYCREVGWGGWIRTNDRETKTRCLAAWLHPNERSYIIYKGRNFLKNKI